MSPYRQFTLWNNYDNLPPQMRGYHMAAEMRSFLYAGGGILLAIGVIGIAFILGLIVVAPQRSDWSWAIAGVSTIACLLTGTAANSLARSHTEELNRTCRDFRLVLSNILVHDGEPTGFGVANPDYRRQACESGLLQLVMEEKRSNENDGDDYLPWRYNSWDVYEAMAKYGFVAPTGLSNIHRRAESLLAREKAEK